MKYILFICLIIVSLNGFSQARVMLNNDVYIVMNNDVYLVVDNPNADAITTLGTGGNLVSEDEFNIVKWNIGPTTGNYIIPFTTLSGIKIPLSINVTAGGAGSGNIQYSTYGGPTWDNNNYKPTGVTNMTNMAVLNNSSEVIDRFWIIDAQGYTTKPGGTIQFNYDDAEHLAVGNTITEADLKAERYDDPTDSWELYPVGGVVNTTSNYVTGVPFNSLDFTRTWTLIDQTTHLLPLVLISFDAECVFNNAVITWQTVSEINTDYFILEQSNDGVQYNELAVIDAAGNSTMQTDYSFIVENNSADYYKLTLVDANGDTAELGIVSLQCGNAPTEFVQAFASGLHQITLQMFGLSEGDYSIQLFDLNGQLYLEHVVTADPFLNQFIINDPRLAAGIYIIRLTGLNNKEPFVFSQKIQIVN